MSQRTCPTLLPGFHRDGETSSSSNHKQLAMHWNFIKNVSRLPVPSKDWSSMRGRIASVPARLAIARDISSGGELAWFSCDALTGSIGGRILQASGMKPTHQHSIETPGNCTVVVAVCGAQPHDPVE